MLMVHARLLAQQTFIQIRLQGIVKAVRQDVQIAKISPIVLRAAKIIFSIQTLHARPLAQQTFIQIHFQYAMYAG